MSNQPTPRRGGRAPIILVLAILALGVLFVFSSRQSATQAPASPTGAVQTTADHMSTATATAPAPGSAATAALLEVSVAPPETPTRRATPTQRATPTRGSPPKSINGLPTITLDQLPAEAITTLRLIARDGPFPFSRDGVTFQNREGILPGKPRGYYREYTVITPGESDRGARRIVAGDSGERYYTDDHYASFAVIVEEP